MDIWFGNFDNYFQVLCILMIIDYISGIIIAIYNHRVNSSIGYKGILKKFGIIVCVSIARQIDILGIYDGEVVVRSVVLLFFSINEILSILENVSQLGVPIPKILKISLSKIDQDETKKMDS